MSKSMASGSAVVSQETSCMKTYASCVSLLKTNVSEESKHNAVQQLSNNLENIVHKPEYSEFLCHAVQTFLKVLEDGKPRFISDHTTQAIRKLLLEIIHRIPTSDHKKNHVMILSLMYRLVQVENEENALVCLRIIMKLHQEFQPAFMPEIASFLGFVKTKYRKFQSHFHKLFEPRTPLKMKDIITNLDGILNKTYTATSIELENADETGIKRNLLPRSSLSLKVFTELPIVMGLVYRLHKTNVHKEFTDLMRIVMETIILKPSDELRHGDNFNREVFADFMSAQIKTMSFIAYTISLCQDIVNGHSDQLQAGILNLLHLCPQEVFQLRRELLVATRYIFSTDLKEKFVDSMDQLFDDIIFITKGVTTCDSLSSLAYSILAEFVQNMKQNLHFKDLAKAVTIFSKNVHDESLLISTQIMSCKLLINLAGYIQSATDFDNNARELLIRMLEIFVLKLKTIVKLQLPVVVEKCRQQQQLQHTTVAPNFDSAAPQGSQIVTCTISAQASNSQGSIANMKLDNTQETNFGAFLVDGTFDKKEEKTKFGFPVSQAVNYNITDCQRLVKILLYGIKTVTLGISGRDVPKDRTSGFNKLIQPKERLVYIRLLKYSLQALDVYTLSTSHTGKAPTHQCLSAVQSPEETKALEYLAEVYTLMDASTFHEIFSTTIDHLVKRTFKNFALKVVIKSFLTHRTSSPIFATILMDYLLKRMGSNVVLPALYLHLFRLMFNSLSFFPIENEQVLKPYVHQIVNKSMVLAFTAEEPTNYFLLLKALFECIGRPGHDVLYQELLPLVPDILHTLNTLQNGVHKKKMIDIFLDLGLTIPVRSSSLGPCLLPMFMDLLTTAIKDCPSLLNKGLCTLELCLDNLSPDFLFEHIEPIRAQLMQALWHTVRNTNCSLAQAALRILGKFGGVNRRTVVDSQKLEYSTSINVGPCIVIQFPEHTNNIYLPVGKIVETAFAKLKSSTTSIFYQKECWKIIEGFLAANIEQDIPSKGMRQLLLHPGFDPRTFDPIHFTLYNCSDAQARKIHKTALNAMYVAASIEDLRPMAFPFLVDIIQHYTAAIIAQQYEVYSDIRKTTQSIGMDPLILIDVTALVMGSEDEKLCKLGNFGLVLIIDTAAEFLSPKPWVSQLPFYKYLIEKMCSLCYDRACFAKLSGCIAIKSIISHISLRLTYIHMHTFVKALLFVMIDLTGQVSYGVMDEAKNHLKWVISKYGTPIVPFGDNWQLKEAQEEAIGEVVKELFHNLTVPNAYVQEQVMHALQNLAQASDMTITAIIAPYKNFLIDFIPPCDSSLQHQPIVVQIGILNAVHFCITLPPLLSDERLFVIDLELPHHQVFFTDLLTFCDMEASDHHHQQQPSYKAVSDFITLKKLTIQVLTALYHLKDQQYVIFSKLFQALTSADLELQETAFVCLKQVISSWKQEDDLKETQVRELTDAKLRKQRSLELNMEKEERATKVRAVILPFIEYFTDYHKLDIALMQPLHYLTQLFPNEFSSFFCFLLLRHLQQWSDVISTIQDKDPKIKLCSAIIDVFYQIPVARTHHLIEPLLTVVLKLETVLGIEAGSPFREPVVKYFHLYPLQTVELLLSELKIQDEKANRFLEYLLKGEKGKPFREVLQSGPLKDQLYRLVLGHYPGQAAELSPEFETPPSSYPMMTISHNVQYLTIRIISLLVKYDDHWLADQHDLVNCLSSIWLSDEFQERHLRTEGVDFTHLMETKLLAKCLLNFVKHNPHDIKLLFQLLRAFTVKYIPDFEFLREFLENTVAQQYNVIWKRNAFFTFVEILPDHSFSQNLKAKILEYILIPSFTVSFQKGEELALIGGDSVVSPFPEQDQMGDLISVFITQVINPEPPFEISDALHIMILKFSCLLVEQVPRHICNAENKKKDNKLKLLLSFAWPCLLANNWIDPSTKYHGHLLLANIIAKFPIRKKNTFQVFRSLLKAYAPEAQSVVKQALEILTPALPVWMESGNNTLAYLTKKVIIEEGYALSQLIHHSQLLVRHYKIYYPVRHELIYHIANSMQSLILAPSATLEHKKLAVDLAEVVIQWELQCHRENQEKNSQLTVTSEGPDFPSQGTSSTTAGHSIPTAEMQQFKKERAATGIPGKPDVTTIDRHKPIDKIHADYAINFLLRMACEVNETSNVCGLRSSWELLSKRCVTLLKLGLQDDVWPNAKLNLTYLNELLLTVDGKEQQKNFENISTALDLLSFLLTVVKRECLVSTFLLLQPGISASLKCSNLKVIKSVHNLLSRLMNLVPPKKENQNIATTFEDLEGLYATVYNTISEGLQTYVESSDNPPSSLFGTLMILKASCANNSHYIDELVTPFIRALRKMTLEHLKAANSDTNQMHTDLLITGLNLVKNRVGVMSQDTRKMFIETILVGLIEKSPSVLVLKAVINIVEDWVKCMKLIALNQAPSVQELLIILLRMMVFIEQRFPNELQLNVQFLELILYVYNDTSLMGTDFHAKLEPAFMAGLRSTQPHIRAKFFEVFNDSVHPLLHERLVYIVCCQNWGTMGPHFWIKQCIELLLAAATKDLTIQSATTDYVLPSIAFVMNLPYSKNQTNDASSISGKARPGYRDHDTCAEWTSEDRHAKTESMAAAEEYQSPSLQLLNIISRQEQFFKSLQKIKVTDFLNATAQLCHVDTALSRYLWVQLFPRLWEIIPKEYQKVLAAEMTPFLCRSDHMLQKHCDPSAIGTFVEGVAHCVPSIPIRPVLLKYLGKSHNIWYQCCLLLENLVFDTKLHEAENSVVVPVDKTEYPKVDQHTALDMICDLYSQLGEEDLWSVIRQKHNMFDETSLGVAFEQHGFFEPARSMYEKGMVRCQREWAAAPVSVKNEFGLYRDHWIRCSKELNDWKALLKYGSSNHSFDPCLLLNNAWRKSEWSKMEEALEMIEEHCSEKISWKVNLFKGYCYICNSKDPCINEIERLAHISLNLCIKEWRRLPHIVSHVHLPMIQATQQITELMEAVVIRRALLPYNIEQQSCLGDIKRTVAIWKHRLPIINDNLSYWSEVFAWRSAHYEAIISNFDTTKPAPTDSSTINFTSVGYNALSESLVHFSKIARKHGLTSVAMDALKRIPPVENVPLADYFQKLKEELKCYLQLAADHSITDPQESYTALYDGLGIIESIKPCSFSKETHAEFYAMRGMYLSQLGRLEEANVSFTTATQAHSAGMKAWTAWGDYLEKFFVKDEAKGQSVNFALGAIKCFLNYCQNQSETKSRKYMAKVLWLLTYDDEEEMQLVSTIDEYATRIPPQQWIPWVPQLLKILIRNEGHMILNVLKRVGYVFPQAIFLPVRTLYLTLELEQRQRGGTDPSFSCDLGSLQSCALGRCMYIIQKLNNSFPTICYAFEHILDQITSLEENVYESVLKQVRHGLVKCYSLASENVKAIADTKVEPCKLDFMKNIVSNFNFESENIWKRLVAFESSTFKTVARELQETKHDESFLQKVRENFATDFIFDAMNLQEFTNKLLKWKKVLEAKCKLLPKSFLLEQKSRYLSLFTQHIADIKLPGDYLLPLPSQEYVRIARFMPRVDIIQKHETAARRLYIRGCNGKVYTYLVHSTDPSDTHQEDRILQLLRMLNTYLVKHKETARRYLKFTVPKVVSLNPQLRLVEDNVSSVSLFDIYRDYCKEQNLAYEAPIHTFYDYLASTSASGSKIDNELLLNTFRDVQKSLVPRDCLKKWAERTFASTTDYWAFRKQFTLQLSLIGFIEYSLHLACVRPNNVYIHLESGFMNVSYFKLKINDATGVLDGNRPVPFRLTPNIVEFINPAGVSGPMCASMSAAAMCLLRPSFSISSFLKVILHDEVVDWYMKKHQRLLPSFLPKDMESSLIIQIVTESISAITERLQSLTEVGIDNKASQLLESACSPKNLCHMEPVWYPWF